MAAEIAFCLLGPTIVRVGAEIALVPPGKQRTVLAALLLNSGRVVSLDELAEILWEEDPPPSARVTLRNYVMRLRKALGPVAGSRISTEPRGRGQGWRCGAASRWRMWNPGCTGDHDQARLHLERSLPLYQRLDDRMGEAWTQQNLSAVAGVQGRRADALGHDEQALRLFQASGNELAEAEMLNCVAWDHALLGDYQLASAFGEQSLTLIAKLGGCHFEHYVWDTLGYAELHLGDFARAAHHFESALGLCRDHGDRISEAEILTHVGDARHAAGDLPRARQAWQQALAIYDDIQYPAAEEVRAKLASADGLPGAGRPLALEGGGPRGLLGAFPFLEAAG